MIGAVLMICWNLLFWLQADVTAGVVVKITPGTQESYWDTYEGGIRYFSSSSLDTVIVEFSAANGKRHAFIPSWIDITDNYKIGDKVNVLYWSKKPQSAKVFEFKALFLGPILVFIMGGIFWITSLFRLAL